MLNAVTEGSFLHLSASVSPLVLCSEDKLQDMAAYSYAKAKCLSQRGPWLSLRLWLYCSTKYSHGTNTAGFGVLALPGLKVAISWVPRKGACTNLGCSFRVWVMLDITDFYAWQKN